MRKLPFVPLLVLLSLSSWAKAQTSAPEPGRGDTPKTLSDTPAGAAVAPVHIPPPPSVNDPMLAPMPPAPRTIGTWEEALTLLRTRSTDLRTTYDQVLQAEAQTRIALATALPSINGSATYTHNILTKTGAQVVGLNTTTLQPIFQQYTVPTSDYAQGSLQVVQPLLALEAWHGIKTAKVAEGVARLTYDDMKRTIALNVASALVAVVTAERVAELNRVGFRNALERLDLAQRKRALGAGTGLDVVRAQQDVETARATLVTGDESLRQSRESLGLAVGIPAQVGVTHDLNLNALEGDAMRACKRAPSLDDRADIAAARARVVVAERNVDDVWYQFAPTVNAQSTLGTTTQNTGVFPNTTWNIQAVLSVPLWDGGARYGNLHNERALADEAVQALESTRRQATVQVEQARRAVSVAEQSRKVAADARALAAETDRLTRAGYVAGQGTSLDLVIAAAALRQADISLALKEFDVVRARIAAVLSLATCPW